jgi:hypothetical protein
VTTKLFMEWNFPIDDIFEIDVLKEMSNTWTLIIIREYKKRLVSRINLSLLLKINLQNTWTLQLNNINQIKSKGCYLQKIIKVPA